ncbi:hypothetical protein C8C85_3747 [Flavobacterium sp. 103]|nr:hypothetical protein C8C85_3747 [Flavobacterium sp. 103]
MNTNSNLEFFEEQISYDKFRMCLAIFEKENVAS